MIILAAAVSLGLASTVAAVATPWQGNASEPARGFLTPVSNPSVHAAQAAVSTPGTVIVKYRAGVSAAAARADAAQAHASVQRQIVGPVAHGGRLTVVHSGTQSTRDLIAALEADPRVVYAEPDYVVQVDALPNDPLWSELWGMTKIGAPGAWSISTGSSSVVIADVDTGVDYTHVDLGANMWHNAGEIPGNGLDDDGNGYIDDVYGIDAMNHDADPMDDHGHGTHTSGTAAAVGNNGSGVAGVCWSARIMALKFLDSTGFGYTSDSITCINYVIAQKNRGVNVVAINASWGGGGYSSSLYDAINAAGNAGILVVAAAGNGGGDGDGNDNDSSPIYPASYALSNIIAVAASTSDDSLASFSNYGAGSVDLAAPGVDILSTVPSFVDGSGYGSGSGTSMAAPHVTGTIALCAALFPDDTVGLRRSRVLDSVDAVDALQGKCATGGRLNVAQALAVVPHEPATTGTLVGTVSANGAALSGVKVNVDDMDPVLTGVDGTYAVSGISPGRHNLYLEKIGYVPSIIVGVTISAGETTTQDVTLRVAPPAGEISGRVTANGVPLAGVVVTAGSRTTTTNWDGRYGFSLTPGSYDMSFARRGYTTQTFSAVPAILHDVTTKNVELASPFATPSVIGTWTWQCPLPQGNTLSSVCFADADNVWAVGGNGTLLHSGDAGATWQVQTVDTRAELRSVDFVDGLRGWAVGTNDTVLRTVDGGATWQSTATGTGTSWLGCDFIDRYTGWLVGDKIAFTSDGGSTWTRQTNPNPNGLNAVSFVDALHGWAVGHLGLIIATSDGGSHWVQQISGVDTLMGVHFVDAAHGWAVGYAGNGGISGTIITTDNGGATWRLQTTVSDTQLWAVTFADLQHGWAAGSSEIVATSDGGITWTRQYYRYTGGGYAIDFWDASHGVVVGYAGGILTTDNGGSEWASPGSPEIHRANDIAFADEHVGWAVGYSQVSQTTDGGRTWTTRNTLGGFAASVAGPDRVYIVGADSLLQSSTDGGATLTRTTLSSPVPGGVQLLDVFSLDATHTWVTGYNGYTWRTTDGGATWSLNAAPASEPLIGVYFVSAMRGWAVGTNGRILATVDGGVTWVVQESGTTEQLNSVLFADEQVGWAAGENGAFVSTADGGSHWVVHSIGTTARLGSLKRTDARHLWLAEGSGSVLESPDGGITWRARDVDMGGVTVVDFPDTRHGWSGSGGSIMATADVTAPTTTGSLSPSSWQCRPVAIDLTARDNPGGWGMEAGWASTEYRIDDGPWTAGTNVIVGAPADHSNDGMHTVAYRSTDNAGNVETSQLRSVGIDTTAPVIKVPANMTVEATGPNGALVSFSVSALDAVDGAVAVATSKDSGTIFPLGDTTVAVTANDAAGNTAGASFKVTVVDTTAPVILVPDDITVEATGPNGALVYFGASALDAVDGTLAVVYSKDPGTVFPLGETTVSVSASDAAGNAATASFKVTVVDSTAPVISHVPADITVEATSSAGGVATWDAQVAFDAVDGTVAAPCQPTSGSTFPLGATRVTVTATDKAGNTASASFKVTVVDSTPPVISAPTTMTVEASGPSGAVVTFASQVAALDAVDGNVTWAASPASGSTFPLGTTTVKVTATDKAGNSASKSFTVSVVDTTGPVISAKDHYDVAASGPSGASVSAAMLAISASDKVNGTVPVTCSPALPFTFPLGTSTLTVSAKDSRGNTTVLTTKINVTYAWGAWVEPSATSYKVGSTVKVAFKLGSGITTARAYLTVTDPSGAKKVDKQPFAYNKGTGEYRFNTGKTYGLVTNGWVKGVYTLSVDLGDGVSHTRSFTLK